MKIVSRIFAWLSRPLVLAICVFESVRTWQEEPPCGSLTPAGRTGRSWHPLLALPLFLQVADLPEVAGISPIHGDATVGAGVSCQRARRHSRSGSVGCWPRCSSRSSLLRWALARLHLALPSNPATPWDRIMARVGAWSTNSHDSSRIAWERAAEAVQAFHGTLHAALRSGMANGEIAGLADREPSNLPRWWCWLTTQSCRRNGFGWRKK